MQLQKAHLYETGMYLYVLSATERWKSLCMDGDCQTPQQFFVKHLHLKRWSRFMMAFCMHLKVMQEKSEIKLPSSLNQMKGLMANGRYNWSVQEVTEKKRNRSKCFCFFKTFEFFVL
jgi:hypothetical protein